MPSFMIDEKKNLVESQGWLLDERKNLVKDQGYVIDEKKNLIEYQGGGEVNPPITEEVDMIKKSITITKPEGETVFTCNGANEFLQSLENLGELISCKINFYSVYSQILPSAIFQLTPTYVNVLRSNSSYQLYIKFYTTDEHDNVDYSQIYNTIQITGNEVRLDHGTFLYDTSQGNTGKFDIVLYFEG